ncbi:hypothetical protein [Rubripirellula obstinata]|uniref:hypothetical protein n=1 Tax=Rubripirellula obstinata TaxID=406547 RepID=UPI000829F1B2|nr:hypothetical protein [Rubripirellula obstinata]
MSDGELDTANTEAAIECPASGDLSPGTAASKRYSDQPETVAHNPLLFCESTVSNHRPVFPDILLPSTTLSQRR